MQLRMMTMMSKEDLMRVAKEHCDAAVAARELGSEELAHYHDQQMIKHKRMADNA